ncbi:MAG: prepilin peptidase [Phycisphaeraceae bacterium]|nr:prepilin peptidase [Phycisphaeraceae bacterium]
MMIASFTVAQVLWFFALGASAGSLINVLVYRLPLGLSVVTPPSRCPTCETRLTWRENIPIFGWLFLGGRCRFCRSKISAEYPIVEFVVAVLFAGFYVLWYLTPPDARFLGIAIGHVAPPWAGTSTGFTYPLAQTWPIFLLFLILLGCLVAMTIVDAKTFTIPLVLAWVPAAAALVIHPLAALYVELSKGHLWRTAPGWDWVIPTPGPNGWYWVGFSVGGAIGLLGSLVLLGTGLITRSFGDYEEWEKKATEAAATAGEQPDQQELWIRYPHARREMVKELAFLAPPVLGAIIGGWGAERVIALTAGWSFDPVSGGFVTSFPVPLWLAALSGVLLGYLVGGGVAWFIRVFGSLGFGKEAMGLGDVHLMAAVGACLGWIDAVIAFFLAAFVGVAWALMGAVFGGLRRQLPYGPHLAVASVLVVLLRPLVELGLSKLLRTPVQLP